jgi:serine/threonine protein kinase
MNSWIGKQIGKCRIEQLLGVGGMGAVYKARHLLLDKIVALKLLHPNLVDGCSGKELVERFICEAQAAAKLEHPNIIPIYDVGVEHNIYYIVMQFISGGTLLDVLGRLSLDKTLWVTKEIAKGLQAAHAKGIIHRDIKPANILISEVGEVKITDFGLAKVIDDDSPLSQRGKGKVFGTPQYLSPEQAMAKDDLDGRADIYSLGVTIFHLLTGQLLYSGDSASVIMEQHVYAPIPSIRLQIPDIPEEVDYLMRRLLAKNRQDRFPTGNEVVKYIESTEHSGVLQRLQANSTSRLSSTRRITTFRKLSQLKGEMHQVEKQDTALANTPAETKLQAQNLALFPDTKRRSTQNSSPSLTNDKSEQAANMPQSVTGKVRIQIGESGVECVPAVTAANTTAETGGTHSLETTSHTNKEQQPRETSNVQTDGVYSPQDKKVRLQLGPSGVECIPAEDRKSDSTGSKKDIPGYTTSSGTAKEPGKLVQAEVKERTKKGVGKPPIPS